MTDEQRTTVIGFLNKVKKQIELDKQKVEQNGFIFANLNDPWQKLAFTLYTDIVMLSTEAEQVLDYLSEG